MPDIKYYEKGSNNLIRQCNGVDWWPQIGDAFNNKDGRWKVIELHIGVEVKCVVEKEM